MTFVNLQKEVPAFEKAFEDLQNRNLSFEVPFVSIHKHFRMFGQGFEGLQKENQNLCLCSAPAPVPLYLLGVMLNL